MFFKTGGKSMIGFGKKLLLASVAAVSGATLGLMGAESAKAQLTTSADVDVQVDVPTVLYLRTFDAITLELFATDLAPTTGTCTSDNNGGANGDAGTLECVEQVGTYPGSSLDLTSPFTATPQITERLSPFWALWTNDADGYEVTVTASSPLLTGAGGSTINVTVTNDEQSFGSSGPTGLENPATGAVALVLDLSNANADGLYDGGVITVTATTF